MTLETAKTVYVPQEDTFFFQDGLIDFFLNKDNLVKHPKSICELGCGSGYLSIQLCKLFPTAILTLIDINADALKLAKRNLEINNINLKQISLFKSDLFTVFDKHPNVQSQFDIIIFNPPYIPKTPDNHENAIERAWNGGESNNSTITRFLQSTSTYLLKQGYIFILVTSFNTRRESIEEFIKKYSKELKIIKIYSKKINFEFLFLVVLKKI